MTEFFDQLKPIVQRALDEDVGDGDVTTNCTIPAEVWLSGAFIGKADGVIAGLEVARLAFQLVDVRVQLTVIKADGAFVQKGDVIARVAGPCRALLTGERGHYEIAAGGDAGPYLRAMERFAPGIGLIPEQIWDAPDLPSRHLRFGGPTGAALPLLWAHAEYVKLQRSAADGKIFDLIEAAVNQGFTSVMIDASALPLEQNIAVTREVVAFAHSRLVSVEAELGRIGSADLVETDTDEELFTDPQEAAYFVQQTGIDALAVSVGTAHGVYQVRQPKIDLERLKAIRLLTPTLLVLHGGSGTPIEMIQSAIRLEGGGVSKVNVATDLELALLASLGLKERMTDSALRAFPAGELDRGAHAVKQVVEDKIVHFLTSNNHARDYPVQGSNHHA